MDQLEIMRAQLNDMKSQLDTQIVVNHDLLYKVMRHKSSWLNTLVTAEIFAVPVFYLLFVGISALCGVSQWYPLVFLIISAIDTALDWRTVRIPATMFGQASIVEFRKFLLRQKRQRFLQMCIALPAALIWMASYFYAIANKVDLNFDDSFIGAVMTGGVVGGIVGAVVGIVAVIILYRRMQGANDVLLNDLNDLESGLPDSNDVL